MKFKFNIAYRIPKLSPMTDPIVTSIAQKLGKTPSQVLLRFLIQLGVAVIPKSTNPDRIRQNFEVSSYISVQSTIK